MRPTQKFARRHLLSSVAALAVAPWAIADAKTYGDAGGLPWRSFAAEPPPLVTPGPWVFFTPEEGALIEAMVDRLIPPDPETPGGKDCGCAVFIDRQLAGGYGRSEGLYMRPPFQTGTPEQGLQSPLTPAELYRRALADVAEHCRAAYAGKQFGDLPVQEQDALLAQMEKGAIRIQGSSSAPFFEQLLQNTREGFFADPVYGGNRDMAAWRMIGFPGARYDFRDWVERYNERYPYPPVSIGGRKEWAPPHA